MLKSCFVDGRHFPEDRITILKGVGSFIESPSFYANLTGRENLDIIRRILGLPGDSVDDALELVGLEEFGGRLAKKYSLGMKQRLGLAGALLGRPPVLILDEPTRGIDVGAKYEIYCIINELAAAGKSVIMISSELPEIINMSDRVYVMNDGRVTGCLDHDSVTQEGIMQLAAK